MRLSRLVSAVALLLLIAPAVAAIAMQCGIRPCPMTDSAMDCMHSMSLEADRSNHGDMACCEKEGDTIASLHQAPAPCCSVSEQETPDAVSIKRFQTEEPTSAIEVHGDSAQVAGAHEAAFSSIPDKAPRSGPPLFTLHNAFLI